MSTDWAFALFIRMAATGTVIIGAAWLIAIAMRRRSAATRHLVWVAATAALLAFPLLNVFPPALRIPVNVASVPGTSAWFTTTVNAPALPGTAPGLVAGNASTTPAAAPFDGRFLVVGLWSLGAALLLFRLAFSNWTLARARRSARSLGECDNVPVFELQRGAIPFTAGILRPAIFLPVQVSEWPEDRKDAVLQHELAHVTRGDLATQALARTALVLYWWHPLAWFLWREFVKERERAADDLVLASGAKASDYAAHLLEVARGIHTCGPYAAASVAMARPSQLESRLLAILDPHRDRKAAGAKAALAAVLAAVVLIAPIAAVRAQDPAANLPPDVQATIRSAESQRNFEMLDRAAAAFEVLYKFDIARQLLDRALVIRGQVAGTQSPTYAAGLVKLGDIATKQNKYDESDQFYRSAIALGDSPQTAPALFHLGIHSYSKDAGLAQSYFDRALAADPTGPYAGPALTWMANLKSRDTTTLAQAEQLYQRALALEDPRSLDAATTMEFYSRLLVAQGRAPEAASVQGRATQVRRSRVEQPSTETIVSSSSTSTSALVERPSLMMKIEPQYSEEARAAKLQGTVRLQVTVDVDGVPKNIQVIRGLGLGLDEKAMEAVSQWRFKPGTRDGHPVASTATIEINFRLMDGPANAIEREFKDFASFYPSGIAGRAVRNEPVPTPGVFRVGDGGVVPPELVTRVEPDYSAEARAAKYQGTVLLYVEVGVDGVPQNIQVSKSLGLGLDERAIEAVRQWRFRPGTKDGKPVTVAATIEVNFRLM